MGKVSDIMIKKKKELDAINEAKLLIKIAEPIKVVEVEEIKEVEKVIPKKSLFKQCVNWFMS